MFFALPLKKSKQGLKIIMNGTEKELNLFIQGFRKEFMNLPPEDIAYPRSCNGLQKWRGTHSLFFFFSPIKVKGAILYTYLIQKENLQNKFPNIQEGDKIKFLHMKQPNLYQCSSFSFPVNIPRELDIVEKIDYDTQFEKSFVEPLKFISEKMSWLIDESYGTQGSLEAFFG